MADKVSRVLLDYVLTPGFQKTQSALKSLVVSQEDISKALAATNKVALTTEAAIAKVNGELAQIARQKAIGSLASNFKALEAETGSTREALKELTDQLVLLGASDAEIQQVTRSIVNMGNEANRAKGAGGAANFGGNIGRSTADLRGILGAAGGGSAIGVAGDILDLTESLPKLKSAITELPSAIGNAAQAIGPLGLVVAASIGAIALAFNKMNSDLEPARQALEATLAANRKYAEFLASGATTKQVEDRIKELEKAARLEQEIIDGQTRAMDTAFEYSQKTAGDFITRLAFAVGDGDDKVAKSTEEARARLLEYNAELSRLRAGLEAGATAANDAAANEEKLAKLRAEATEKIIALEAQRDAAWLAFNEQAAQIDEDRAIRSARADEDLKAQLARQAAAHHDRMIAIADAGQQRLEQIKTQGNEKLAQADEQLGKLQQSLAGITTKLNQDRAKVDRDYMASERAAYEKFRLAEAKATEDYNKARTRRLQDLNDDLLDAEQANDVTRFIAAKRAADKDLKRMAEDADATTKERQRQFDEERALAEQRRQERVNDLEAAAAERRADLEAQIQERRAAREELAKDIAAQLDAEKQRILSTQKAEIDAYIAQQKRDEEARDLRNKRQAEDEALADSRRRAALNKQLAEIETKINAEKNAAGIVGNAWTNMALQVGQVIRGLISTATTPRSSITSGGGGNQAFATGGIVTRPTIAKIGERPGFHEAVIPFRPSEGLDAALARHGIGGGKSGYIVNFNAPISVGDGVSEAQLRAGLHELAGVFIEGLDTAMRS